MFPSWKNCPSCTSFRAGFLNQFPGQQHPSSLAANFAMPQNALMNGPQVTDPEDLFRQPYERQLIADHSFDQDDQNLAQVMPDSYLIFTLDLLKALALTE